jgi:protein involved in polysaccharide export with SLBB domain
MVQLFQFQVNRDLSLADDKARFPMQAFDYVYIRKAPSYYEQKTVTLEGEVVYPGQYSIQSKSERIFDVLQRAGGVTSNAYLRGASLFRRIEVEEQDTTTRVFDLKQQQQLRNQLHATAEGVAEESLLLDSLLSTNVKRLKTIRVELQMDKILKDTTSIYNYHLREGDRILIPEISEEVFVNGAILNPVGLAYEKGRKANYYISRSGGFSNKADKKKVYVIYSDGTTKVTRSFIFSRYPEVQPGSRIIVPEKEQKEGVGMATWLSIASTFASLAIAVAAIIP